MAKGQRRDGKREAFWRKALACQRNSGLNVRQWCARENLPEPAFYFWRRTIAQRDQDAARGSEPVRPRATRAIHDGLPEPTFVPVTVAVALPGREHSIVIRLRGGRVMRLPVAMDARRVAELVHAIEGEPVLSLSKGVAS